MATEITYILNGVEYIQPRQAENFEIQATFDGDSIQANVTTTAFSFVNDAKDAIIEWQIELPTEGMPLLVTISGQDETGADISLEFDFYLDLKTLEILSDIECEVQVIQRDSLANIDERSRSITMRLLFEKGFLGPSNVSKIPYVVENRKTTLEFISIGFQLYQIIKQSIDEIFKIVNIVGDILSGAAIITIPAGIIAAVNLTISIAQLVVLTLRSRILFIEIGEAIFPALKFHRGFTILEYLQAGFDYMEFDFDIDEFGSDLTATKFRNLLRAAVLCPSKSDEVGDPIIPPTLKQQLINVGDGVLKPGDFGYLFSEVLELVNSMGYTKMATIGNKVVLLPLRSNFWDNEPAWDFPSTLIEQGFISNGSFSFNYDEMYGRHYIEYTKDESDLFTLTNVNKSIHEVLETPISVLNVKNLIKRPSDFVKIPYALAIRRPLQEKEVFSKFFKNKDLYLKEQKKLQKEYDKYGYTEDFGEIKPPILTPQSLRNGAMMVEHDYFRVPKIVTLNAKGRLETSNIASAKRLFDDYHVAKSFAFGAVTNEPGSVLAGFTPQKKVFSPIRIPFSISDFQQTIINGNFNLEDKKGRLTTIKWKPFKDRAVVEFYIKENWNLNLEATEVKDDFAINNPFE